MENLTFRAMVVREAGDGRFERRITEKKVGELPPGDVLMAVKYSSLNYKDALSATGNRGVTRSYPHTPGIDAAGVVVQGTGTSFQPGDEVIVTSYDLGMNTAGGFGGYIRVPAEWVVPKPAGLTLRESMIYGTAGFTAALSVYQLTAQGVTAEQGEILVSGATGGVGSVAVSLLSRMGFSVTAVNGRTDKSSFLKEIGARSIISIQEATDRSGRPLLKGRWAGSIDAVGGELLATTIKALKPGGVVTCCGNAASPGLPLNVFPFILRGARMVGIDSQNCPMATRVKIWDKIADEWKIPHLASLASETTLDGLSRRIEMMLAGKLKGRTLVRVSD